MTIHKEGKGIIYTLFILLLVVNCLLIFLIKINNTVALSVIVACILFILFIVYFFRKPVRKVIIDNNKIYAPADGHVVVVEETYEDEYYKDKRIQISIFMSIWNIHIIPGNF
jgi:phosphatidylserine decarboxylase